MPTLRNYQPLDQSHWAFAGCRRTHRPAVRRCGAMTLLKRRTGRPKVYCPNIDQTGPFRVFFSVPVFSAEYHVSELPRATTDAF